MEKSKKSSFIKIRLIEKQGFSLSGMGRKSPSSEKHCLIKNSVFVRQCETCSWLDLVTVLYIINGVKKLTPLIKCVIINYINYLEENDNEYRGI